MNPRVLVVDDSLTVRMDLGDAFEAAGMPATRCASGAQMREALASDQFSLVVLDLLLPDADGIDLLRELRGAKATADVPVMLLTTEAEVRDRVRGLTTGADEFIGKPYETDYVVARAAQLARGRVGAATSEAGFQVLVIEDSLTFRQELQQALEGAGYSVLAAGSGEEGLRLAAIHRPSAAVIDGNLPGIDGRTVIRRLRSDNLLQEIPCLLLTAAGDKGDELSGLEAGADAYVLKTEELGVVLARLAALLRGAGPKSEGAEHAASLLAPKKILAIDDSETYLQAVGECLREDGYDAAFARSGEQSLELLAVEPFDGILLDVMMPGLGGLETARRIKGAQALREIPLIMLTGKDDREAMIEGLNAGADDYVAKSSDFDVLKGRLRAQLRRKHFQDEHRRVREELVRMEVEAAEARAAREMVEAQQKMELQLSQAGRLAAIGTMASGVAHEVNNPLGFILSNLVFISDEVPLLAEPDRVHEEQQDRLSDVLDALKEARHGLERVRKVVQELQAFSHVDEEQRSAVDVRRSVEHAVKAAEPDVAPRARISMELGEIPQVLANAARLSQVMLNLIMSASHCLPKGKPAESLVTVRTRTGPTGKALIEVASHGPGMGVTDVSKMFDAAKAVNPNGSGLGLSICQGLVSAMGGRIAVESTREAGLVFKIELPAAA